MSRLSTCSIGAVLLAALFVGPVDAETPNVMPFGQKLKLAKTGDMEAQIAVARAYESGEGTGINTIEAAKWYRKAADQGNAESTFRLARIVGAGAPGISKNPELAAKLYEAAARLNHSEAQNWLGYSYQHGLGLQQSDANALEWYKKAAGSGLAMAQNNLGLMYLNGKGVARDYAKAFALFEQAAQQGNAWAINNLGGLYEMGWGVAQDRQKAFASYKQAFEKGNANAGENMKRLSAALGLDAASASVEPVPEAAVPRKAVEETEPVPAPVEPEREATVAPPPAEKPEKPGVEPPPVPAKPKAASIEPAPLSEMPKAQVPPLADELKARGAETKPDLARSMISETAGQVGRDYVVDGQPSSGAHKRIKQKIRDLFATIDQKTTRVEPPPLPRPRPRKKTALQPSLRIEGNKTAKSTLSTNEQAPSVVEAEPAPKPRAKKGFSGGTDCRPSQFKRFAAGQMRPCDYF